MYRIYNFLLFTLVGLTSLKVGRKRTFFASICGDKNRNMDTFIQLINSGQKIFTFTWYTYSEVFEHWGYRRINSYRYFTA